MRIINCVFGGKEYKIVLFQIRKIMIENILCVSAINSWKEGYKFETWESWIVCQDFWKGNKIGV